jgi:4-amino-4-deoxy-L-arabinose transferase-like glycosyltransferase
MSISVPSTAARRARPAPLERVRALRLPRPELAFLLVLAAVLDLWSLALNGWANTYYSAAVRSMSTNWHDFLFASFDKAGVMTVDKPPLALWVQALSARVFGFNSLSILVPQALMGVATVALAYDLTRRRFGRAGGFVAGLVLATTPMTVAISRHNNPDALLVLCCTAALWAIVRALEDGRTRWLVLSGVLIGLGFETKMLAALIVVPALAAAYLWVAPRGRGVAIRQLAAGGAVMAVVGLAWPVLVWLTPAGSRPWISGTSDNSIWSLIFGYNGLGRVDGQSGGPGGAGGGPGGGGAGNSFFGGQTGAFRLLNSALGGQAGWLLGFAIVGGLAIVIASRLRRADARTGWVIAAGGAFLTTAVVFSTAKGIFHPYYVSLLAPFIAVLVGAGAKTLLDGGVVNRFLAPLAVAGGLATELVVLHNSDGQLNWVIPVLVIALVATAAVFATAESVRARVAVLAVALAVLLIAPATWAAQTIGHPTNGTFPSGGPVSASMDGGRFGGGAGGPGAGGRGPGAGGPGGGFAGRPTGAQAGAPPAGPGGPRGGGGGGLFGGNSAALNDAVAYVSAHGGGTIGVSSQTGASGAIISNGVNVAGLGGFSGRESEVSVSWLAQAVQNGQIRWVLSDGTSGGMPNDSRVGSQSIMTAVAQVGKKVTTVSGATLYDLQGRASALLALG